MATATGNATGTLTADQIKTLQIASRVGSCFSLAGCTFICITFLLSSSFRRPFNRLVFYTSWGNLISGVATLLSQAGIEAGADSTICQVQGFLIQMFHLADALWNLAIAINVYLAVFRRYNAAQLKSLEWIYLCTNYGGPFVIAFIYCFIATETSGKIYGPATLWCWVSIKWNILRITLLYGPVWVAIAVTFTIYLLAGRAIFQKRKQLRSFNISPTGNMGGKNPYGPYKTTDVEITSEPADLLNAQLLRDSCALQPDKPIPSAQGYKRYSINIERAPMSSSRVMAPASSEPPQVQRFHKRQNDVAMEANTAAWNYTKCALLFFLSLLITWVPSSINRVYTIFNPGNTSYSRNFAASLVLPLMGFWNSVIYITISWHACKKLFTRSKQHIRTRVVSTQLNNEGRGRRLTQNSMEISMVNAGKSSHSDSANNMSDDHIRSHDS